MLLLIKPDMMRAKELPGFKKKLLTPLPSLCALRLFPALPAPSLLHPSLVSLLMLLIKQRR